MEGTVGGTRKYEKCTLSQKGFQPAQRNRIYHQKQPETLVIWCHLSPVLSGVRGFVEEMCWCDFMDGSKDCFLGEDNGMPKITDEKQQTRVGDNTIHASF